MVFETGFLHVTELTCPPASAQTPGAGIKGPCLHAWLYRGLILCLHDNPVVTRLFVSFLLFLRQGLSYSLAWPQTPYVAKDSLELWLLPPLVGRQVCTSRPSFYEAGLGLSAHQRSPFPTERHTPVFLIFLEANTSKQKQVKPVFLFQCSSSCCSTYKTVGSRHLDMWPPLPDTVPQRAGL